MLPLSWPWAIYGESWRPLGISAGVWRTGRGLHDSLSPSASNHYSAGPCLECSILLGLLERLGTDNQLSLCLLPWGEEAAGLELCTVNCYDFSPVTWALRLSGPLKSTHHQSVWYLTPARMAVIKKSTNSKCWRGCGEKGTLLHRWWECKLVQPPWRTVWRFLKNWKQSHHMTLKSHSWAYFRRKTWSKRIHALQCSLHAVYNSQDMEAT